MKRMSTILSIILFTLVATAPLIAKTGNTGIGAQRTIAYYFDLIESQNYESALGLWLPDCLKQATRLGIEYDGIPIKPDATSPVMNDFKRIRPFLANAIRSKAIIDTGFVRLKFALDIGTKRIDYYYYIIRQDGYDWLVSPTYYYTREWPEKKSKYFIVKYNPLKEDYINELMLASMDDFVEHTAKTLGLTKEDLDSLAVKKIYYYLCNGKAEMMRLSGAEKAGVYNPAFDIIIAAFIPQYHNIAELLTNYKLKKLPVLTNPFIQKGGSSQDSTQQAAPFTPISQHTPSEVQDKKNSF